MWFELSAMQQHKHKQKLRPAFEVVGLVIAGVVSLLLILWLIEPCSSVEDIFGPQYVLVVPLLAMPLAILCALTAEAIGKLVQHLYDNFGK